MALGGMHEYSAFLMESYNLYEWISFTFLQVEILQVVYIHTYMLFLCKYGWEKNGFVFVRRPDMMALALNTFCMAKLTNHT